MKKEKSNLVQLLRQNILCPLVDESYIDYPVETMMTFFKVLMIKSLYKKTHLFTYASGLVFEDVKNVVKNAKM